MLNERKPLFLGVCYKLSQTSGVDISTIRILWIVASIFTGVAVPFYFIFALVDSPQMKNKNNDVSADYQTSDEVIVNGVRGEDAVINEVRKYEE